MLNGSQIDYPYIKSTYTTDTVIHINSIVVYSVGNGGMYSQAITRTIKNTSINTGTGGSSTNIGSGAIYLKGRRLMGSLYDDTNSDYYEFSIILLETSGGRK
jgi:hypothetical protein